MTVSAELAEFDARSIANLEVRARLGEDLPGLVRLVPQGHLRDSVTLVQTANMPGGYIDVLVLGVRFMCCEPIMDGLVRLRSCDPPASRRWDVTVPARDSWEFIIGRVRDLWVRA